MCILSDAYVLIVPYGIETEGQAASFQVANGVLIVPYGIETCSMVSLVPADWRFNRTLWNWNVDDVKQIKDFEGVLIVPYGIETL